MDPSARTNRKDPTLVRRSGDRCSGPVQATFQLVADPPGLQRPGRLFARWARALRKEGILSGPWLRGSDPEDSTEEYRLRLGLRDSWSCRLAKTAAGSIFKDARAVVLREEWGTLPWVPTHRSPASVSPVPRSPGLAPAGPTREPEGTSRTSIGSQGLPTRRRPVLWRPKPAGLAEGADDVILPAANSLHPRC